MKKNNRTPPLGSFEQLESRALLAHAGLPQGLSYDMHYDQQPADFNRGPRLEMQARGLDSRGPRGEVDHRGNFNPPLRGGYGSATGYETAAPVVFIPVTPVLIIITLPSFAPASPQFSEPLTSAVRNTPPQSQRVSSFNNPPSSNLQSTSTPSRASSTSDLSLNSLSVLSDTALKRSTSTDLPEADDAETAAQAAQDDDQPTREEQESQQLIRQSVTNETALQSIEADEDADLIELDPAELLKRTKRKSARAATGNLESSPARKSTIDLERRLPHAAENWLTPSQIEEALAPVNDDLIELLTADHVHPSSTIRSTAFAASASLQLEATVGFHQTMELTDATIPVEAQPATVAAAALPAREAQ